MRCRGPVLIIVAALILFHSVAPRARAATVDPPMRITVSKLDRSPLAGMITSYDDEGFEIMDAQKQTTKVKWEELPPDTIMNLNERLVRKGTGDDWFKLGQKLLTMPGGRAPAERAFQKALRLQPALKPQIEAARKEAKLHPPTATSPAGTDAATRDPNLTPTDPNAPAATPPGSVNEPKDPSKPVVGPQQVGQIDPSAWGQQSPEQTAAAIAGLKAFAVQSARTLKINLQPYETQYFLFYSDLPTAEAQKWAGVLDRMYVQLSQLFGVPKNTNIWRGKALVFVFSREEDYLNFQMQMHDKTMATGTAGMCHTYGSGVVHIAFYRQPNDFDFAHVLVHESVHGFLHRYRSPERIPSWANEGLAETIASELVPERGRREMVKTSAREQIQQHGNSRGNFFQAQHIEGWQYPVAETMCSFMITANRKNYVDFITGIKDGLTWEQSLQQRYKAPLDRLVAVYGSWLGVRGLTQ